MGKKMYYDIIMYGWETPFIFTYGGLGVFGENLVMTLSEMGYKTLWIGCTSSPSLIGSYHNVINNYDALVPCLVTDLSERNIYEIWERIIGKNTCFLSDKIIIHDMHLAVPAVMHGYRYRAKSLFYAHIVVGEPLELFGWMKSNIVATNSNLSKNIVDSILSTAFTTIEPKPYKPPTKVIYPAVPSLPEPDEETIEYVKHVINYEKGDIVIHVHGRNQFNKNQKIVVKVWNKLRKKYPRLKLVISGRGFPFNIVGNDKLVYWGNIRDTELVALYRVADIGVFPSLIDPFGLVALEMASQKLPVIISKNTGVAEVLESAPKFNPEKPEELEHVLETLINDPGLREKIGEKIYVEATRRTWKNVANEIIQSLENTVPG